MNQIMLEARELEVGIAGRRLCQGLSFSVRAGEAWGVLGVNGCGKTTLLHTLAGLRRPQGGRVLVLGDPVDRLAPRELALRRGLMPQTTFDAFSSSAFELALAGRHPHLGPWAWESAEDQRRAWDALNAVGLAHCASQDTLTLSGGERRRLALATLLAQDPPLMLLDEPTGNLDLHQQVAVLNLLDRLRADGKALVMVLHDLTLSARYCDHLILLDGARTRVGEAAELLDPAILADCFRHAIRVVGEGRSRAFVPA
jgi:iron complex transport system ATP-binding protein